MRLNQLNDEFVECRGPLRHRWDQVSDDGGVGRKYKASRTVIRLAKRCERCHTLRHEAWNAITGEILFVDYTYPEGYKIDEGDVKPFNVRLEFIKREKKRARQK